MKMRWIVLTMIAVALPAAVIGYQLLTGNGKGYYDQDGKYLEIEKNNTFGYIEKHPAFEGFSEFIQPWKDWKNRIVTPYLPLRVVCAANHADADSVTEGLNFIVRQSQERKLFFDIYSEEERREEPAKANTGLYFIPGAQDQQFVFLVSGGGFQSVCNFLEAFPVSRRMHEAGYHVFILQYRVDSEKDMVLDEVELRQALAVEDFGRAMQYIFDHADELGVNTESYAVCGFSAGGRLCHMWGLDNEYGYGNYEIPKPVASMLIYSGWDDQAFEDRYSTQPPTYFAHVENDITIGTELSEKIGVYAEKLRRRGIPVEEHIYTEAMHGFGAGTGTEADGWIEDAVAFWEAHQ